MNPHELEKGYFLSTMIELLNLEIDLSGLDKEKVLFESSNIFRHNFIKKIKIKTKIYDKFISGQIAEALRMSALTQ